MHRTATDPTAISGSEREHDERVSYSVPDAAKLIGISSRRLWDRVRDKRIKSFLDGGRRLISRRALEAYVSEREAADEERAA